MPPVKPPWVSLAPPPPQSLADQQAALDAQMQDYATDHEQLQDVWRMMAGELLPGHQLAAPPQQPGLERPQQPPAARAQVLQLLPSAEQAPAPEAERHTTAAAASQAPERGGVPGPAAARVAATAAPDGGSPACSDPSSSQQQDAAGRERRQRRAPTHWSDYAADRWVRVPGHASARRTATPSLVG